MQYLLIKNRHKIYGQSRSESGLGKIMDPDPEPVCPKRLNPDPVNIRPDPNPDVYFVCITEIRPVLDQL